MTNRQLKKALKAWIDGEVSCPSDYFNDTRLNNLCHFCAKHFPRTEWHTCPHSVYTEAYVRRKAKQLLEEL